jgi:integrase
MVPFVVRTTVACLRGSFEVSPTRPRPHRDAAKRVAAGEGLRRHRPVSKKRLYLEETIPSGPRAAKEAEKGSTRLLAQVDERRSPRTRATINQTFDRYLTVLDLEPTTRSTYEGYIRNHIRPALGPLPLARSEAETVESFYAQLRTCRPRCGGRQSVDHRMADEHTCDAGCRPHHCVPLSASSVRQIHAILSIACKQAVRWKWIGASPMSDVDPPAATAPNPRPPSAEQAASISAEAWKDPPVQDLRERPGSVK